VHEEFCLELLQVCELSGNAVVIRLGEDFDVPMGGRTGEELERLGIPCFEVFDNGPGDAEGAGKSTIQKTEEDLRRRPEGAFDDSFQILLHIRAKVTVFCVSLSLHRLGPKSGIEIAGIMDIESRTDLWWI